MKLTKENIDLIDSYLEEKNLDFLDFKIEIKDHVACEIETKMYEEKSSFEKAFEEVIENWNQELNKTKVWLISNEREFPALITKKIKNKVIIHYGTVIVLSLLLGFGFLSLKGEYMHTDTFLRYTIGICGIVYLFLRAKINRTKLKTSYRFHFDYFYMNVLLVFILLFVLTLNITFSIFFSFIFLVDFPFAVYYFLRHHKFIKQYQLK